MMSFTYLGNDLDEDKKRFGRGNIDLTNRPKVVNPDGSISTVRSMSFNFDGKEVLLPTISDEGKNLSPEEAQEQFRRTGKHLGIFDSPEEATKYAKQLHKDQEKMLEKSKNSEAAFTYLGNDIAGKSEEESATKSATRYGLQIAKAAPLAIRGVPAANLALSMLTGGKLNEEEIPEEYQRPPLGYIGEAPETPKRAPKPPSEQMANPLGELYQHIEEKTGLPLTPKTPSQKVLSIAADARSMSPGSPTFKNIIGITAAEIYSKATEMGIPEDAAANLSMLTSQSIARSGVERYYPKNQPKRKEITQQKPPSTEQPMEPETITSIQKEKTSTENLPELEGTKIIAPKEKGELIRKNLPQISAEPQTQTPVKHELPPEIEAPKFTPFIPAKVNVPNAEDTIHQPKSLNNDIGNIFINRKPQSSTKYGDYLVKTIADAEIPVRNRINEAYEMARYLRQGQESAPTEFASYVQDRIREIENINENLRTQVQKKALTVLRGFLEDVTEIDPVTGDVLFVREVPDDYFYNIRPSISEMADFEFVNPSGKKPSTGEFKRLIKNIDDHLETSAIASENPEAHEAVRYANNLYQRTWAEPFQNVKILPYRSTEKNINHSELYNKTSNIDTFRAVQPILRSMHSSEGRNMEQILKRDMVASALKAYIEDPTKIDSIDFEKSMRELSPILSKEELDRVKDILEQRSQAILGERARVERETQKQKRANLIAREEHRAKEKSLTVEYQAKKSHRAREIQKIKESEKKENLELKEKHEKQVESHKISTYKLKKLHAMTDEQLADHAASSVTGLRDFEAILPQETYETIKAATAGQILYSGKHTPPSPEKILEILSDVKKREILIEAMGAKNVHGLQESSKLMIRIAKKKILEKMTEEQFKKLMPYKDFLEKKFNNPEEVYNEIISGVEHPGTYFFKKLGEFFKHKQSQKELETEYRELLKALQEVENSLE